MAAWTAPLLSGCGAAPGEPQVATVSTDPPLTASASAKETPPVDKPKDEPAEAQAAKKPTANASEDPPSDEPSVEEKLKQMQDQAAQILGSLNANGGTTSTLSAPLSAGLVLSALGGGGLGGIGTAAVGGGTSGPQTVTGPSASVTVAPPVVKGGAVSNASSVVAGMVAGFRRCANAALRADPTSMQQGASGVIEAKISTSGEVVTVKVQSNHGVQSTAMACMAARVTSATFAPPSGGFTAQIEISLNVQVTQP